MSPNETVVPANDVLFEDLSKMLDNIVKTKKKYDKSIILMNFIDDFRLRIAQIPEAKNSTFYPILRLLLPVLERERRSYNLKEKRLGNKLVEALAWDKTSQKAQMLLNYKSNNRSEKDFAAVACDALKYTVSDNSSLTVGDINQILDNIANVETGKPPTLEDIFTSVLKRINVRQLKWLLRIILKDLKLNMGQTRIFAALDSDAEKFYNYCNDLQKVCQEFDGGNTRPSELGVEIYKSIRPMLLTALPITKLSLLSPSKTYITEEKYDGERFQIHMKNHEFMYFTRMGHESHNFGKNYDSGMLTPLLKGCFAPDVESFILDGEMLGWNEEEEKYGSKGMNFDVKALKEDSEYKPSFCAFDILYYNGKSLVGPPENGGMTLIKRLEILDKIFKDIPEVITHSKSQQVKDISDINVAFNKSVDDEKEGITVKDTESYYIANRRDASWFKIKGEYTKSTIQDLDLVIIGKTLKRRGWFYVACVDNSGASQRWLCMTSVRRPGREQYGALCARLRPYWRSVSTHPPPASLVFNKKHVDFWLPPEHSIVLQVRASELTKNDNYGTPYTLRFQRIIKVRYDKPVNDIFTLQEFEQIVSSELPVVKLSKKINQEEMDSLDLIPNKKRMKTPPKLAEPFRSKSTGNVIATSKALLGRKVYILSDDIDCDKAELVKIVESHGGKHSEKYCTDTWCCVAGVLTPYVKTLIESTANNTIDIATTSWLRSLPLSDEPCSLSPLDMLTIKKGTRLKMSLDYDDFGDSYKKPLDIDTLKKCFEKIDGDKPMVYLTTQEKIKVDQDLFPENNPFSYLRGCFLAFVNNDSINAIRARLYGANLCATDSANVTHVVLSKMASIDDKMAAKKFNALVVTEHWLEACFEEGKRVQEHMYIDLNK